MYVLLFAPWGNFHTFFCLIFSKIVFFFKNSFRNTIRASNSLDPDQARHFDRPDLGQTVCKSYQQKTLVGNELDAKVLNWNLQDHLPVDEFRLNLQKNSP